MTATMAPTAPAAPAAPRTARPLATIEGTMLTPGVSLNKRLYTRDAIGRAVSRMKERLGDPAGLPIVMRTHHDAGDNSRLIVGRIVDVAQQPDTGAATYRAELFDTSAGRDISTLIGQAGPALKSTSIYGYWLGPVEQRRLDGDMIETAADLEIDAIDFTASPGVPGAQISRVAYESVASGKPVVSGGEVQPRIQEPGQATITPRPEQPATWPGLDEVADRRNPILEKYTAAQRRAMAAKGQARSDGSYPVASKSDLRNAIKAVGSGGGDDDGVRRHIIARAEALGLAGMIPVGWRPGEPAQEAAAVQQATPPPPAAAEAVPATPPAAVVEGVTEGVDVTVCVSDQDGLIVRIIASGVDPDEVKQVTKRAAKIAARALNARDNDDTVPADMTVTPDGMPVYPDENHTPEGTVTQTPATTQAAPNPQPAQQRWSITVNGEELAADEAKALVAAALTTETRQPADTPPATETTPVPAAPAEPATAPVVDEQKGVAVSDTAKVAPQATPTAAVEAAPPAPAAQMSQQDLIALVAETTAAAVTRALKAEKKAAAKATETAPAAPAAPVATAVAETAAPVVPVAAPAAVDTTQTTPVAAAVTHAQMEERLKATVDQLREQLLKERGLPPRRGHRYVTESDEATGQQQDREDLWDNRSQVWDQFFPASMTPAPAAALAAAQDVAAQ